MNKKWDGPHPTALQFDSHFWRWIMMANSENDGQRVTKREKELHHNRFSMDFRVALNFEFGIYFYSATSAVFFPYFTLGHSLPHCTTHAPLDRIEFDAFRIVKWRVNGKYQWSPRVPIESEQSTFSQLIYRKANHLFPARIRPMSDTIWKRNKAGKH